MKKLVITGHDLNIRAIITLVGKIIVIDGWPYLVAGGEIPQGAITRYECPLYQIYHGTTLVQASGVFRTHGRATVIDVVEDKKGHG